MNFPQSGISGCTGIQQVWFLMANGNDQAFNQGWIPTPSNSSVIIIFYMGSKLFTMRHIHAQVRDYAFFHLLCFFISLIKLKRQMIRYIKTNLNLELHKHPTWWMQGCPGRVVKDKLIKVLKYHSCLFFLWSVFLGNETLIAEWSFPKKYLSNLLDLILHLITNILKKEV